MDERNAVETRSSEGEAERSPICGISRGIEAEFMTWRYSVTEYSSKKNQDQGFYDARVQGFRELESFKSEFSSSLYLMLYWGRCSVKQQ